MNTHTGYKSVSRFFFFLGRGGGTSFLHPGIFVGQIVFVRVWQKDFLRRLFDGACQLFMNEMGVNVTKWHGKRTPSHHVINSNQSDTEKLALNYKIRQFILTVFFFFFW